MSEATGRTYGERDKKGGFETPPTHSTSFCLHGHMTSILLSILEKRSSSVALLMGSSLFSLFSSVFGLFFLIRCEVKGQGCRMSTGCKTLGGEFVICDFELYKINCSKFNLGDRNALRNFH